MQLANNAEDLQYRLRKYVSKHRFKDNLEATLLPPTGHEMFVKKSIKLVDFAGIDDALNTQLSQFYLESEVLSLW